MFLQKRQSFYQFLIIYQRTSLNLFCECYSLPVVRTFITSQTGILMWIFQFNESGKIIWTDAQSALALGYQDAHQLLDLAADLFIHISRFSR